MMVPKPPEQRVTDPETIYHPDAYERAQELGRLGLELVQSTLESEYSQHLFTFEDLKQFFAENYGKGPQEAGKTFKRYWDALDRRGVLEGRITYEEGRVKYGHRLAYLTVVLQEDRELPDDVYTEALRQFHANQIGKLFVK